MERNYVTVTINPNCDQGEGTDVHEVRAGGTELSSVLSPTLEGCKAEF